MNLDFLPNLPSTKEPAWIDVQLIYLGAENYVLGKSTVRARFIQVKGGFSVQFKNPAKLLASKLMGKKFRKVTVVDIIIRYHDFELSAKCLVPSKFPRTYQEEECVELA